uniref:C2H2 finger domain n=1 Tax=Mycena chlorophos TaxID=658473 RepID=A0ABQ0KVG2_MYCCL|nr:C2H2 finger domain [Mycena chlorophos]
MAISSLRHRNATPSAPQARRSRSCPPSPTHEPALYSPLSPSCLSRLAVTSAISAPASALVQFVWQSISFSALEHHNGRVGLRFKNGGTTHSHTLQPRQRSSESTSAASLPPSLPSLLIMPRPRKPAGPFPCDNCGKMFARSGDLNRHKKLHLTDAARSAAGFRCEVQPCEFFTFQKTALNVHMNSQHLHVQPYKCIEDPEHCQFASADPASLHKHKQRYHAYRPDGRKRATAARLREAQAAQARVQAPYPPSASGTRTRTQTQNWSMPPARTGVNLSPADFATGTQALDAPYASLPERELQLRWMSVQAGPSGSSTRVPSPSELSSNSGSSSSSSTPDSLSGSPFESPQLAPAAGGTYFSFPAPGVVPGPSTNAFSLPGPGSLPPYAPSSWPTYPGSTGSVDMPIPPGGLPFAFPGYHVPQAYTYDGNFDWAGVPIGIPPMELAHEAPAIRSDLAPIPSVTMPGPSDAEGNLPSFSDETMTWEAPMPTPSRVDDVDRPRRDSLDQLLDDFLFKLNATAAAQGPAPAQAVAPQSQAQQSPESFDWESLGLDNL